MTEKKYKFVHPEVEECCKQVPFMSQNDWCVFFAILNYIKDFTEIKFFNDLDYYCKVCEVIDDLTQYFLDSDYQCSGGMDLPYWVYNQTLPVLESFGDSVYKPFDLEKCKEEIRKIKGDCNDEK